MEGHTSLRKVSVLKELTLINSRLDKDTIFKTQNQPLISSSYNYLENIFIACICFTYTLIELVTKYIFLFTQISKGFGQSLITHYNQ